VLKRCSLAQAPPLSCATHSVAQDSKRPFPVLPLVPSFGQLLSPWPPNLGSFRERDCRPWHWRSCSAIRDPTPWVLIGSPPASGAARILCCSGALQLARSLHGVEIHQAPRIGPGCFSSTHGMGVVIGANLRDRQPLPPLPGRTLGGTGKVAGNRHPTTGENVVVARSPTARAIQRWIDTRHRPLDRWCCMSSTRQHRGGHLARVVHHRGAHRPLAIPLPGCGSQGDSQSEERIDALEGDDLSRLQHCLREVGRRAFRCTGLRGDSQNLKVANSSSSSRRDAASDSAAPATSN